jgi:microcompartment protein CcmK/EutM
MRLGVVRGSVVLSLAVPELQGIRLAVVEPITRDRLAASGRMGGGKPIVAADQLGSGIGHVVGFIEGRTAASPFWPGKVPVDAYCALIAENIEYRPPDKKTDDKKRSSVPLRQDRRQKTIVCPTTKG